MASTAEPIASPMSPAIKRSTRKRQRPSFFAEEIAVPSTTTASSRKHSSSNHRSTRPRPSTSTLITHAGHAQQTSRRGSSGRSELSQLQDTVTGLQAQIELATVQMQELRSLVTMLADLYRRDDGENAPEEPVLFSAASSEQDHHETDDVLSSTTSEYDAYEDDEDELLTTPLSPLC